VVGSRADVNRWRLATGGRSGPRGPGAGVRRRRRDSGEWLGGAKVDGFDGNCANRWGRLRARSKTSANRQGTVRSARLRGVGVPRGTSPGSATFWRACTLRRTGRRSGQGVCSVGDARRSSLSGVGRCPGGGPASRRTYAGRDRRDKDTGRRERRDKDTGRRERRDKDTGRRERREGNRAMTGARRRRGPAGGGPTGGEPSGWHPPAWGARRTR
jgi:hypothetical protein